jgi:Flp pilus assembly CpaE family ATPase
VQKSRFRTLSFKDAESALGRKVDFSIASDAFCVSDALTRGDLVQDLHPSSRAARDLNELAAMLLASGERG